MCLCAMWPVCYVPVCYVPVCYVPVCYVPVCYVPVCYVPTLPGVVLTNKSWMCTPSLYLFSMFIASISSP